MTLPTHPKNGPADSLHTPPFQDWEVIVKENVWFNEVSQDVAPGDQCSRSALLTFPSFALLTQIIRANTQSLSRSTY